MFLKETKELNQIAIPLMLNAGFGTLIALIDQAMVGHAIGVYAGAIGQVSVLLFALAGILGATSISFNILASKCWAKEETKSFNAYFSGSLWISILLVSASWILLLIFNHPLLRLLYGLEGNRLVVASQYLNIMSIYVLLQLVLFTFSSLFKIVRATQCIFISSTTATVVNVILNYLLIFGHFGFPRLEVRGAAIATVIAMVLNIALYFYFAKSYVQYFSFKKDLSQIRFILKKSFALMGQEVLEGSLFIVGIGVVMERIGGLEATGYNLIVQLFNLMFIPMYMYSTAVLTLVSARNDKCLVQVALKLGVGLSLFIGFTFLVFRTTILGWLNKDPEVALYASRMLGLMMVAHLFNPMHTIYKSALQALGQSGYVLIRTFVVNGISFLMMILISLTFEWQELGVFLGLFVNYFVLAWLFKYKYNQHKSVK